LQGFLFFEWSSIPTHPSTCFYNKNSLSNQMKTDEKFWEKLSHCQFSERSKKVGMIDATLDMIWAIWVNFTFVLIFTYSWFAQKIPIRTLSNAKSRIWIFIKINNHQLVFIPLYLSRIYDNAIFNYNNFGVQLRYIEKELFVRILFFQIMIAWLASLY
jgi:hypothetical protein